MYQIEFAEDVEEELGGIRPFDARAILDAIDRELKHRPATATRNRKPLAGISPPFNTVPPVWELRVGDYRVFYDVNEEEARVYVRAVRRKPPHKTTREIL